VRHRFFKFYFKFSKMPGIPSKIGHSVSVADIVESVIPHPHSGRIDLYWTGTEAESLVTLYTPAPVNSIL
jgi:hypothetical protein